MFIQLHSTRQQSVDVYIDKLQKNVVLELGTHDTNAYDG